MVFSSNVFLFLFFPLTIIAYYLIPNIKYKNYILLIASLIFYAWGEPVYIILLIFASLSGYLHSIFIAKANARGNKKQAKFLLISAVSIGLLLLGYFKYSGFLINNINLIFDVNLQIKELPLPIGISFFTFQILSYVVDVYRQEVKIENNFLTFVMYVAMFPQLIAGPIVRYSEIESEVHKRTHTIEKFANGVERFIFGFSKKLILANTAGYVYTQLLLDGRDQISVIGAWFAIIMYTLQIYFDFSSYSDMAIGLSQMFGFSTFPENFNYPYLSKSIGEFWRRWHMTLGRFFKDYVYIPLGGSRVSYLKWVRNLFIVWGLTGLWHGAEWNFIIWGLYFGVIIFFEKYFVNEKWNSRKVIPHVYSLFLILIGWMIFDATVKGDILFRVSVMFTAGHLTGNVVPLINLYSYSYIIQNIFFVIIGIVFCTKMPLNLYRKLNINVQNIILILLFIIAIAFMTSSTFNPFIYFRF